MAILIVPLLACGNYRCSNCIVPIKSFVQLVLSHKEEHGLGLRSHKADLSFKSFFLNSEDFVRAEPFIDHVEPD